MTLIEVIFAGIWTALAVTLVAILVIVMLDR